MMMMMTSLTFARAIPHRIARPLARSLTHAQDTTSAQQHSNGKDSKEGREEGRDSGVIWAVINEPRDTHEKHVARKHIDRNHPYDMESQNALH